MTPCSDAFASPLTMHAYMHVCSPKKILFGRAYINFLAPEVCPSVSLPLLSCHHAD